MTRRAMPFPCAWLAVPDRSWSPDGASLTAGEAMVLAVFVDRWRRTDIDLLVVSSEDLARAAGLSLRGAEGARESLVTRKVLVRVHEGGGRGRPSTYRLGAWAKSSNGNPAADTGNETSETPQETPQPNPATAAWLLQKPAVNPAVNPAASPQPVRSMEGSHLFLKQRSEAETEGERASAWRIGYARRWERSCGGPSPNIEGHLPKLANSPADPERALDGFFATPRMRKLRPPFDVKYLADNPEGFAACAPTASPVSDPSTFEPEDLRGIS